MTGFIPDRRRPSNHQPHGPHNTGRALIDRVTLYYGDITNQPDIEVIVSAIGQNLNAGGSLNQSINRAAGTQLDDFILENIYKPRVGDVFAMPPFNLPNDYIFYAITPNWDTLLSYEDRGLQRCYRHALQLAARMGVKRIAFPAIATGKKRYPPARAARLAVSAILDRLTPEIEEVRIVCDRDELITVFYERLQKLGWKGKVVYQG